MPEISVIVPVYKTQEYLPMCIESILKQSFLDFELILADDCSPDDCPRICDEYAQKDMRIQVLHLSHGGVSRARNAALDISRGKYVVFCDSDDYVGQNYLRDMIEAQKLMPTAFVITDYTAFSGEGAGLCRNAVASVPSAGRKVLDLDSFSEADYITFVCEYRLWGPYCKLFKKDLIDEFNLRYDVDLKSAEDFAFNIEYLRLIKYLYYVPISQYSYRIGWKSTKSNFIDLSAVKSAHIIVGGMTELANRANIYGLVSSSIQKMAAEKFYFSRLPMIFTRKEKVRYRKRKEMFDLLCNLNSDATYMKTCMEGTKYLPMSFFMRKASKINQFWLWWLFYWLYDIFRANAKA